MIKLDQHKEYVTFIKDHGHQQLTNPFAIKFYIKSLINITIEMHASYEIGFSMTKAFDDGTTESIVHGVLREGDNCTVTSMGQNPDKAKPS